MEAKKARGDIVVYLVLSIASIIFYRYVIPTQIYMSKTAQAETFSPDTFPNVVSVMFIIASVCGLVLAVYRYCKAVQAERKPQKEKKELSRQELIGNLIPLIVFLLVLLYAFLFKAIGFIAATAIVPPVILFVIGCRKWHYYPIYYAFAAIMYLLFRYVLLVPIR